MSTPEMIVDSCHICHEKEPVIQLENELSFCRECESQEVSALHYGCLWTDMELKASMKMYDVASRHTRRSIISSGSMDGYEVTSVKCTMLIANF